MSDKNTPPHARLEIRIKDDLLAGGRQIEIDIQGCRQCLIDGIARHLLSSEPFKEVINKAIRLANERRAQKEN